MIASLMAISVRARWAVVFIIAIISAFGVWQLTRLPIDAVPDITNKQVQINTVDPGLSPIEIEKRVTFPWRRRWPAFRAWKPRVRCPATSRR